MRLTILGVSGSIGKQTIDIIETNKEHFEIVGVSVGENIEELEKVINKFSSIGFVCVKNEKDYNFLKKKYKKIKFYFGDGGLISLINDSNVEMVVNALVGFVGLPPTIYALENNIDVAIANKESIVVGGELINNILKNSKAKLYPIDSEHVALNKCLKGNYKDVAKLILTASGGAFRSLNRDQLKNVTKEDALKHPSWTMGEKITIDCATMMNKGFEIIEAHYLFGFDASQIEILLHDESKVHSLILLKDGSYLADIGPSDMRIPISYALFRNERVNTNISLPLSSFGDFHFHDFKEDRYPCVSYALKALKVGGTMLACLNASNEEAVKAFLEGKISFLDIEKVIELTCKRHRVMSNPTLADLIYADKISRDEAKHIIEEEI